MLATSTVPAAQTANIPIESLKSQLSGRPPSTGTDLTVISANPRLDMTGVATLHNSGALILRSEHEALSRSLEAGPLADAVVLAVTEAGITNLTLVGHSFTATVPLGRRDSSLQLQERVRLQNDRITASKLKLKDDLCRFVSHAQIKPLLTDGVLTIHALSTRRKARFSYGTTS